MNSTQNKRKGGGGRPGPGRRSMGMARGPESKPPVTDGVYSNARLTHAATALVGCTVQVQVKNGGVYEGIFRTFSPKMDVVLEVAHKIDEGSANQNAIPNKDRLIEKVIFNLNDIVVITGLNVDLDYACKDTFTDASISNFNGKIGEKELTPWDAAGSHDDLELDSAGNESNGWDVHEMFKTNQQKFNVTSTYDPNLSQYTTPLNKTDSADFKAREERAHRLAQEIESSDSYRKHIALEDESDKDEEMRFSAVVRNTASSPVSSSNSNGVGSGTSTGKYVPPHLRKNQMHGRVIKSSQSPSGQSSPQLGSPKPSSLPPSSPLSSHPTATLTEEAAFGGAVEVKDKEQPSPTVRQMESASTSSNSATVSVGDTLGTKEVGSPTPKLKKKKVPTATLR